MFDLRRYRNRAILAIAASIAIHEMLLGVVPSLARPHDREDAPSTRLVFESPRPSPTPKPTQKPTPKPTPTPPPVTPPPHVTPKPVHVTPAPVRQIAGAAKGVPSVHHGGSARHVHAVSKAHSARHVQVAVGSGETGVGAGTGNGVGNGSGGKGGNGTGSQGNGNGAVNADTPCGVVDFIPTKAPRYSNGTAYETVRATVTFANGETQVATFPYEWVYPNGEQTDPWSDTNLKKKDFEIAMQLPPPGANVSSYDPILQYIIKHTGPGGLTDLPDCPKRRG